MIVLYIFWLNYIILTTFLSPVTITLVMDSQQERLVVYLFSLYKCITLLIELRYFFIQTFLCSLSSSHHIGLNFFLHVDLLCSYFISVLPPPPQFFSSSMHLILICNSFFITLMYIYFLEVLINSSEGITNMYTCFVVIQKVFCIFGWTLESLNCGTYKSISLLLSSGFLIILILLVWQAANFPYICELMIEVFLH